MIYIWIDPEIVDKHVGIRRVLFNLKILANSNKVNCEFLLFEPENQKSGFARQLYFTEKNIIDNNFLNKQDGKIAFSQIPLKEVFSKTNIIGAPWLTKVFFTSKIPLLNKPLVFLPDIIPIKFSVDSIIPYSLFSDSHCRTIDFCLQDKVLLIVCSFAVLEDLIQLAPKIDSKNVLVLHPGVYVQHLLNSETLREHRERQGLLFVNLLDRRKGLKEAQLMLDTFSAASNLTLVGNQRCTDSDLSVFMDSTRRYSFKWLKSASTEEIIQEYHSARLLVFPSKHEGYGIPSLEANFLGLTVLTYSNLPSWKDLRFKLEIDTKQKDSLSCALDKISDTDMEQVSNYRKDLLMGLENWFNSLLIR